MSENRLPGEKVATIEEYLPGENTFEDGDAIRSASIGTVELNKTEQLVSIQNKKSTMVPKIGDIIVGNLNPIFLAFSHNFILFFADLIWPIPIKTLENFLSIFDTCSSVPMVL